jgi:ABC-type lipoprotein release transport system permease subunit
MKIPLLYNLRNLRVRKFTTLMTALGTSLSVAVLLSVLALVSGLRTAFEATGHPQQLLVTRKGSSAELTSVITRETFHVIKSKAGIACGRDGQPMASLEMVTVINIEGPAGQEMNVNLRGLMPVGVEMRPQLQLRQGRIFQPGRREVIVGKGIADRYSSMQVGHTIQFGRGEWEIVGIVDGGRSAFNSEILGDVNQISADYNRSGFLSSVLIRAEPGYLEALARTLEEDPALNVRAEREQEYYTAQTRSAAPVQFMGMLVAAIMAVGSAFAAMNTMYAAVARRASEIGTLRVLGFSRGSILASFLVESLLLSILGGIAGCLLVLPLNNLKTGIGSFTTFAEMTFTLTVTPAVLAIGLSFALLIGALGGFLPAHAAARKQILAALRGV